MLLTISIILIGLGIQGAINNARAQKRHEEMETNIEALLTSVMSQQTYSRLIMMNGTSLSKALGCVLENQKAIMLITEQIVVRQNRILSERDTPK